MAQWQRGARELAAVHARALAALSDEEALRASESLLALATPGALSPDRLRGSGLVAQQALLHRRPS